MTDPLGLATCHDVQGDPVPCPQGTSITVTADDPGPMGMIPVNVFGPITVQHNSMPGLLPFFTSSGLVPLPPTPCGKTGLGLGMNFGQYVSGIISAASMFGQFLTGTGPSNLTFSPHSVESQMMSSSVGVTQAINNYSSGKATGLYTFGVSGLWNAGLNPIQQFVGSYRWNVVPTKGGLDVTLSNRTSLWSGSYHLLPNHSRSTFGPLGNTYQTYEVFVPCHP